MLRIELTLKTRARSTGQKGNMNMNRILAVFMIAFTSLFATSVGGQQQIQALQSFPQVGTLSNVENAVVSMNQCGMSFQLQYTTISNTTSGVGVSPPVRLFSSYLQFQQFMASNGMYLVNLLQSRTNIASPIRFIASISYYNMPNLSYAVYSASTNIGQLSTITSNTFMSIVPTYTHVAIPVPGLQKFRIDVATSPPYYAVWPLDPSLPPCQYNPTGLEQEHTTTDLLVLNQWYLLGNYEARCTVVVGGVTNVFNTVGELISQPGLHVSGSKSVSMKCTRDTDVTLQISTDLIRPNWTTVTNWPWTLGITNATWTNPSPAPRSFYRILQNAH